MSTAAGPTSATHATAPDGKTPAPAPKLTFIPDILEEHLAELAFLWGQRQGALRSPDYSYARFLELEDRISAHLHGVMVVGERGLPWIEAGFTSDDALDVFASGFSMLHMRDPALDARCLILFAGAEGARLDGLRLALCHGPMEMTAERLTRLAHGAPGPLAAAAAEALAFHGQLDLGADRLRAFLASDVPTVREAGWRLVAYLLAPVEPKAYDAALHDDDAAVRRGALLAGAWCGEPAVLAAARALARTPSNDHLDALHILAVLGTPDDVAALEDSAQSGVLGPDGVRLLGSLGHPSTMGTILREMENTDPTIAAAAGAVFLRMTGVDVTSATTAKVPSAGGEPDEFEAEFQEEVAMPDVALAHREWQAMEHRLAGAPRVARGLDLGREFTSETFAALDMESRWEACLRGRFHGAWAGSPVWLESFPQPR